MAEAICAVIEQKQRIHGTPDQSSVIEHELHHPDMNIPLPEDCFEEFHMTFVGTVDILLAVVTKVEFRAVFRHMSPLPGYDSVIRVTPNLDTYHVGCFGVYGVALVQCDMGSGGSSGSHQVIHDALQLWKPKAAIMIGIAFGLHPDKQSLGDVLVSQCLATYDLQRVDRKITPRGSIVPSGPHLSPRFLEQEVHDWMFSGSTVNRGVMLSGSVLVDSEEFAKNLLFRYPEALGGDMEGEGVFSASFRHGVEWIVVKGICDFAGLKGSKNKNAQPFAAAAASLVKHVLSRPCLGGLGCQPVDGNPVLGLSHNAEASFCPKRSKGDPSENTTVYRLPRYNRKLFWLLDFGWQMGKFKFSFGSSVYSLVRDRVWLELWDIARSHDIVMADAFPSSFEVFSRSILGQLRDLSGLVFVFFLIGWCCQHLQMVMKVSSTRQKREYRELAQLALREIPSCVRKCWLFSELVSRKLSNTSGIEDFLLEKCPGPVDTYTNTSQKT